MKKINFLHPEEFRTLRVIRIEGNEWNKFTGYLSYLRKYDPENYDADKGDVLDEKILNVLQQNFPNSKLRYINNIFFEDQLKDSLKAIKGGAEKDIIIQFYPIIPYADAPKYVGQSFSAYPVHFKLRLQLGENSDKIGLINEYYLCSLPLNKTDELVKTIFPV